MLQLKEKDLELNVKRQGRSYSSGKSAKYRFIEFFVFDSGALPYLLSLFFFWWGVTFPLLLLIKCDTVLVS